MATGIEVLIRAPRERHDALLREGILPLTQELEQDRAIEAVFFTRHNKPDWHLKLAVLGGSPGPMLDRTTGTFLERGWISGTDTLLYEPDHAPNGGEDGTRLAERVFHHDSRACLSFLELEAAGRLARSRRELSLLLTERYLDLLGFSRAERVGFYRFACSWAVELGHWRAEERSILDRKYADLAPGLSRLLADGADEAELWGGTEAAHVARSLLEALAPLAFEIRRGMGEKRILRDPITLAWWLTHLHANRLQIEAYGEAILRYLMQRYHEAA